MRVVRAGHVECEIKSDSSPEREQAPEDEFSKDLVKRKRKPYRPGEEALDPAADVTSTKTSYTVSALSMLLFSSESSNGQLSCAKRMNGSTCAWESWPEFKSSLAVKVGMHFRLILKCHLKSQDAKLFGSSSYHNQEASGLCSIDVIFGAFHPLICPLARDRHPIWRTRRRMVAAGQPSRCGLQAPVSW